MNAADFRERALLATEPLQPGPASYEWLRDNVARRRRATRVLTAVTAAGCVAVAGVALAALPGRTRTEPVGPAATTSAPASGAAARRPVPFDVDADGKPDDVFVVDERIGRWGVEVRGSRIGDVVLWMDDDSVGRNGHAINGTMHMDSEPGAETLVGIMQSTAAGDDERFLLVVVVDGRPVWLTDQQGRLVRLPGDHMLFDCTMFADGRRGLVITADDGSKGTYEIVRGVLRPVAAPAGALESCYLS